MEHLSPHRILTNARRGKRAGFSLVELLVVLAIIGILSTIVFSGQLNFNRTLSLNNAAYDIALSIRQAQSYGLSSQAFTGISNPGYGVYFQKATPSSYIFFSDIYPAVSSGAQPDARPGDGIYEASPTNENVQTYGLNNGFTIPQFCAYSLGAGKICTTGTLTLLSITFARPNALTTIKGNTGSWNTYTDACVKLTSATGDARYISVSETGQVQVGTNSVSLACP